MSADQATVASPWHARGAADVIGDIDDPAAHGPVR